VVDVVTLVKIKTARNISGSSFGIYRSSIVNQIFLPYISSNIVTPTQEVTKWLLNNSQQCRDFININPSLVEAAEYRANHMADNDYFNHTDPLTGETPNEVVTRFGFDMHSSYPSQGNNGESISAGRKTIRESYESLLDSPPHRKHLLGLSNFFCQQREIGVGFAHNENSTFKYYFVVLIYRS